MFRMDTAITYEEFVGAAEEFAKISNKLQDGWKLMEDDRCLAKCHLKKECFIEAKGLAALSKAEFVIFYNLSYGVPSFSFNVWNSSGALLSLEDVRQMAFIQINQKDFYSVITQQEHPIFHRPYFIVHPCQTDTLLAVFKNRSKNIIVTFLGLITPLLKFNMPMEYGL